MIRGLEDDYVVPLLREKIGSGESSRSGAYDGCLVTGAFLDRTVGRFRMRFIIFVRDISLQKFYIWRVPDILAGAFVLARRHGQGCLRVAHLLESS